MAGRSGADQFSRFLSYVALALIAANLFVRSNVLWVLALLVLVYTYYRMFSKNVARRREENGKYLQLQYKLTVGVKNCADRWKQRKEFVFFRCPDCRAMLRVPRGKGRIRVTCRKCGNAFEKKT